MKNRTFHGLKLVVAIFLILHVICPIIALAAHISIGDISEVISSAQFGPMLWNSFISSLVTTIVSVSLALLLAWCVNRTRIRHKRSVVGNLYTAHADPL